ncbi:MAG: hypothetical protein JWQ43_3138, partial [Glaciihabitans sp.]|nr:hypothetical protein [Glaciihabitans sp.]
MPESVESWWARRQWTKGCDVPYPVGTFRADWERYPVLIRQYHPEFNHNITLTQVPPAADVYLVWQCDVGHHFVATPEEQRNRPGGGARRRSVWCPECAAMAVPRRIRPSSRLPSAAVPDSERAEFISGVPASSPASPPTGSSRSSRSRDGRPSQVAQATAGDAPAATVSPADAPAPAQGYATPELPAYTCGHPRDPDRIRSQADTE